LPSEDILVQAFPVLDRQDNTDDATSRWSGPPGHDTPSEHAIPRPQRVKNMHKSFLSLLFIVFVSGVASVAEAAGGITAEGEVYNLTSPADLSGDYSAVTAGVTIIEGGSVAYLKNDKGVVIKLHSQTGGLRFNLSANGMHIALQQP
jgi:hypothetical protein